MAKTVQDIAPGGGLQAAGTFQGPVPGNRRVKRIQVTGDNSYPTGGYPIAPADFNMAALDYVRIINDGTGAPGGPANVAWFFNKATQKLQLIVVSTGAELANATDVHLCTADLEGEGF